MGHFFQVPSDQSSSFAWLWVCICYNSESPLCVHASLSQDGFQRRGLWEGWQHLLWGGAPFLFGPWGAFLHMHSWEGLLDLKNEKYVVSLSLIWAGLSSSLFLPLSLSWSICPQGTDFSCLAWGPSISCLSYFAISTTSAVTSSTEVLIPLKSSMKIGINFQTPINLIFWPLSMNHKCS